MRKIFFIRLLLFIVAGCGGALVLFGGWIAWRGVVLYAGDPVLMGTGGGLAIGGLLVVALTLAALVQLRTAETAAAILDRFDVLIRHRPSAASAAFDGRQQPRLPGQQRGPDA